MPGKEPWDKKEKKCSQTPNECRGIVFGAPISQPNPQ